VFDDTGALPRKKFLIRKLAPGGGEKLLVGFERRFIAV